MKRLAALIIVTASACDGTRWSPGPVGAPEEGEEGALATAVSFVDDVQPRAEPSEPRDGAARGPAATNADAAPRVLYLWYSDGGPAPAAKADQVCTETPPKYTCAFGTPDGDCQRKVQTFLDMFYKDFNLIFTLTKPTTGRFYTSINTPGSPTAWCKEVPGDSGGGALSGCSDLGGGASYAFHCDASAKVCATIIAQENAHMVGLVHTSSKNDVMYPAVCSTCMGFEDNDNTTVQDWCHRPTQNSYKMMKAALGSWAGGDKPDPFGGHGGSGGVAAAPDAGAGGGGNGGKAGGAAGGAGGAAGDNAGGSGGAGAANGDSGPAGATGDDSGAGVNRSAGGCAIAGAADVRGVAGVFLTVCVAAALARRRRSAPNQGNPPLQSDGIADR